ncbi:hypothetical protein GW17_00048529 [Ensete ventricosum]|nr:hypothetical protein GW17_00048529 [Ensete ventricosum]
MRRKRNVHRRRGGKLSPQHRRRLPALCRTWPSPEGREGLTWNGEEPSYDFSTRKRGEKLEFRRDLTAAKVLQEEEKGGREKGERNRGRGRREGGWRRRNVMDRGERIALPAQ